MAKKDSKKKSKDSKKKEPKKLSKAELKAAEKEAAKKAKSKAKDKGGKKPKAKIPGDDPNPTTPAVEAALKNAKNSTKGKKAKEAIEAEVAEVSATEIAAAQVKASRKVVEEGEGKKGKGKVVLDLPDAGKMTFETPEPSGKKGKGKKGKKSKAGKADSSPTPEQTAEGQSDEEGEALDNVVPINKTVAKPRTRTLKYTKEFTELRDEVEATGKPMELTLEQLYRPRNSGERIIKPFREEPYNLNISASDEYLPPPEDAWRITVRIDPTEEAGGKKKKGKGKK